MITPLHSPKGHTWVQERTRGTRAFSDSQALVSSPLRVLAKSGKRVNNLSSRLSRSRRSSYRYPRQSVIISNICNGCDCADLEVGKEGISTRAFSDTDTLSGADYEHLGRTVKAAFAAAGVFAPHPRSACVIVDSEGNCIHEEVKNGQGGLPAEMIAVESIGEAARGATMYLNLEFPYGLISGEHRTVDSIVSAGIKRVVIGILHPLPGLRGCAVQALRAHNVQVDVLEDPHGHLENVHVNNDDDDDDDDQRAHMLRLCRGVNEAILHRVARGRPLSVFKYAMTLDGKIATVTGHSAWVSGEDSRAQVWSVRSCSDVVIVGGETVRKDNPRLTTRREDGHIPLRCVMSRTLDMPDDAEIWDTTVAPTIVFTETGARPEFQTFLTSKGVEVVEFDILTPSVVADYFSTRGCLQLLWECGGSLAAPAITDNVIHKVMSFIAPKIIGGGMSAPSPLGNLGFDKMTQALKLLEATYSQVGDDLLVVGYTPASGGLAGICADVAAMARSENKIEECGGGRIRLAEICSVSNDNGHESAANASDNNTNVAKDGSDGSSGSGSPHQLLFYKAWDTFGALSNFSPHPITMEDSRGEMKTWPTVEHYYQTRKFDSSSEEGRAVIERILEAPTPEEAAKIGRTWQRQAPHLMVNDWNTRKEGTMLEALKVKFRTHEGPRRLLLATAGVEAKEVEGGLTAVDSASWNLDLLWDDLPPHRYPLQLVEESPHDYIWGSGLSGEGKNLLGVLLMQVRDHLIAEQEVQASVHSL